MHSIKARLSRRSQDGLQYLGDSTATLFGLSETHPYPTLLITLLMKAQTWQENKISTVHTFIYIKRSRMIRSPSWNSRTQPRTCTGAEQI